MSIKPLDCADTVSGRGLAGAPTSPLAVVSSMKQIFLGCLIVSLTIAAGHRADAIPAYASRTGLACATCHSPAYPRLTRFGWDFRQMGYRTPDEVGKRLLPFARKPDSQHPDASGYGLTDALSIGLKTEFDDIQRQKAEQFAKAYVPLSVLYLSGPLDKNVGYYFKENLNSQFPLFNRAQNRYGLSTPSASFPFGEVRFFAGKPGNYFSARIGQFFPQDGYGLNDQGISISFPLLMQGVNQISASKLQKGVAVGYTLRDNYLGLYALQGVPSNGDGNSNRSTAHPDFELQYLRFLGKDGSSIQAVYSVGQTPLNTQGTLTDNYGQLYLLGNWRRRIGKGHALNLLAGWGMDSHDKLVAATSNTHGRFDVNSLSAELDYEVYHRFIPYMRFDTAHSGETRYGAVSPGNPASNTNQWTFGISSQPVQNIRLTAEFAASQPSTGPQVNYFRTQLWFVY